MIFIAGNIPGKSQIAPLQIITKLDDFRYAEATAIGVVLLCVSLVILLLINGLEWWSRRHETRRAVEGFSPLRGSRRSVTREAIM